jgi:tetratricopeptide (TPR) repeat protein
MRRGLLFLTWMLWTSFGWAQAPEGDPAVALHTTGGTREGLVSNWMERQKRLERNESEEAARILGNMVGLRRDRGLARLDSLAVLLIREAEAAAKAGALDVASDRLAAAERMAPGLPEVHHAAARVALELQPWAVHRYVQHKARAMGASLADFQYRILFLADLMLMGLLVVALLGVVFTLAQLGRYGLNLYHELGQTFPGVWRVVLLAAVGLVVLLPFFFGFGPLGLFFPAAILLWPYQMRRERLLSVVFVGVLGAAPWALRMADRLTEAGTGITQALHALSLNPDDERAREAVEARLLAEPTDWHARAVLGLAEKRRGVLASAIPLLTQAAQEAPEGEAAGTVQNNLGNALFAAGRADKARTAYLKAAELLPRQPAPLFNLSRLELRQGKRAAATETLDKASRLDADAVSRWNEDDDLSLNRHVVDLPLPAGLLTRRALSDLLAPTPLATRAWVVLAGPVPEPAAPVGAGVTLLAFGVLGLLGRRLRLTWPCARTGRPVMVYRAAGYPERPLCDAWIDAFVKNVPMDRQIRFGLEVRAARYLAFKRWGTRVAGLVPGLVGLLRGAPLRGTLVLGVATVLGLLVLMPNGLLLEPIELPTASIERWVLASVLGIIWAVGLVRAFRWPEEVA